MNNGAPHAVYRAASGEKEIPLTTTGQPKVDKNELKYKNNTTFEREVTQHQHTDSLNCVLLSITKGSENKQTTEATNGGSAATRGSDDTGLPPLDVWRQLGGSLVVTVDNSAVVDLQERQSWDKKMDFLLALIGFAIDLGNVWRFPYICYKNGGGAFLIPYLVMLIFLGLPLFYMELALGQFHRMGAISIWRKICPMFCGLGFGTCVVAGFVGGYYNTIIAWALYYLLLSLRTDLLYAHCHNAWNTPSCVEPAQTINRTNTSVSAATEFFNRHVLEVHRSRGIDDLGHIKWQLLLCLLAVFLVVFFCCWKGTKSTGKAVWITATLPFVLLVVLLVRGVTLPGAGEGVIYYLRPDFSRLATLEVWVDAAAQIFFSLGPGFGVLIALSSYNRFHNNCLRDAVLTASINCGTSLVAGVVVFSVLGYMARLQHTTVDAVATHGPGLVFVVYAEAVSTLPGSPFFALAFFLMLITLGLDSTFGGLESIMTALADEFQVFRHRRTLVVALVVSYCFLIGLPTVTYGGNYFIYLMDTHAAPISLLAICFTEVIALNWFYGVGRFADDVQLMLGSRPCVFWRLCWCFVCPIGLLALLTLSVVGYQRLAFDGYVYPPWAEAVGWLVTCMSVVCIPGYVVYAFCTTPGTWKMKWRLLSRPQAGTFTGKGSTPSPEGPMDGDGMVGQAMTSTS